MTIAATLYIAMMTGTLMVFGTNYSAETLPYFVFVYVISNFYLTLFYVVFGLILYAIYRRFEAVNDCIRFDENSTLYVLLKTLFDYRQNFKTEVGDVIKVFGKDSSKPSMVIVKLADLHDLLNDLVDDINRYFSFQVSLMNI